jgi:hypothetical protein
MLTHATGKEVGKGSKIYLEVGTGKTDRKEKEEERERYINIEWEKERNGVREIEKKKLTKKV